MDSATGPDHVPTRILKECAGELDVPLVKLARRIVSTGVWPSCWLLHWVCPLHKRLSRSDAKNYRGIQLTAQTSKAMERLLGKLFLLNLHASVQFEPRQYAYTPGRGARDALLTVILEWLVAFATGRKVILYCSDVAGAFDKVPADRLSNKHRRTIDGGVADGGVGYLFYDIKVRNAQSVVSWLVGARCG